MIRVLHVVLSLETGGLENGVVNLVNHADEAAFQVDVLCLRAKGALAERVTHSGSRIIFDRPAVAIPAAIAQVFKVCFSGHYDIVHTHGWATLLTGFIAARMARVPVIINGEHGVLYHQTYLQRWLQRRLFTAVTGNISVCADLVQQISQHFGVKKKCFQVIPNGVDTQKFTPNPARREQLRQDIKCAQSSVVIGSVGRLEPIKNYPLLLRAVANVRQAGYDARLLLVGDGSELAALEQLARQLKIIDYVIFAGQQRAVDHYLQVMEIFVLPSLNEGLSNTLLEAMSTGIVVLATDVGGNVEIVNQKTGFLFPSEDEAALTAKLIELIDDPDQRRALGGSAREYCVQHHSISAMVRAYEQTYQQLIQQTLRTNRQTIH